MATTSLKHRYSFSGSDTKAFGYYRQSDNNGKMYHLESMHTLSCSVFEAKGRVRSLGFKSIRGFTRAVREISGTMIMLVIEDHPLASLMKANPFKANNTYGGDKRSWSIDGKETARGSTSYARYGSNSEDFAESDYTRIPTTLPPFNIFVTFQSEIPIGSEVRNTNERSVGYDPGSMLQQTQFTQEKVTKYRRGGFEIQDVEILGEGIVTSVNDMVTEIQYQFVARDYKEFSLDQTREFIKRTQGTRFEKLKSSHERNLLEHYKNPGTIQIQDGTITLTNTAANMSMMSPAQKQLLGRSSALDYMDGSTSLRTKEEDAVRFILEQNRLNDEKKANFNKAVSKASLSAGSLSNSFDKQSNSGKSQLYGVYAPRSLNGQEYSGHDFYGQKIPGTNVDIEYYTVYPREFDGSEYSFKVDLVDKSGSHTHERVIKNNSGVIDYADFLE